MARVAVLQAYHERLDGMGEQYPTDTERLSLLLEENLGRMSLMEFDLPRGNFPHSLDDFDGIVVTGSPDSVHDDLAYIPKLLSCIRHCARQRKKLLGICFGHQAIGLALGGKVGHLSVPWNLGMRKLVPAYDLVSNHYAFASNWGEGIYAMHNEQVTKLPEGFSPVYTATGCEYAVVESGGDILTTQFHPEMSMQDFQDIVISDPHVPEEYVFHERADRQPEIISRRIAAFFDV
jgi:GMP synthase-like glutamine amidotransferase